MRFKENSSLKSNKHSIFEEIKKPKSQKKNSIFDKFRFSEELEKDDFDNIRFKEQDDENYSNSFIKGFTSALEQLNDRPNIVTPRFK